MDLVIGVDAGGTATRCVVAGPGGRVLGAGGAGGLNQRSSGGDGVDRLVEAISTALGERDPLTVRAGVLGVAGAGAAGLSLAQGHADEAWRRLRLGGSPRVVPDLLVAFAAGSAAPTGAVLVAGTGAGAAAIVDRTLARQADGAGWLLGDIGSAVWLAREALVAAVADLDGRGPTTAVTTPLCERLLGRPGPFSAQDVIGAAYAASPASLGRLAPVVTAQTEAGDPVAAGIVRRGVAGLLASLDAVRPDAPGPVVLAGALLTHPGPVSRSVRDELRNRGVDASTVVADPAAGGAWLAFLSLGAADPAVHRSLVGN